MEDSTPSPQSYLNTTSSPQTYKINITSSPQTYKPPTKCNTIESSSNQRYTPLINNSNNKPITNPLHTNKPSPAIDYNAAPKTNKYEASFATICSMFKLYKKYFQFETIYIYI